MHLLISDLHFGKGSRTAERAKEARTLSLIDHVEDRLDGLYLLGDVFDQFIEYRHLVPKGFVRFQATLARLTSAGIPVWYVVGNHDPWHLEYFTEELGVGVCRNAWTIEVGGVSILLAHGDGVGRSPLGRAAQRVARHPVSMAFYRTFLPADFGYVFARFAKRRLESGDDPEPAVIERLRDAARRLLAGDRQLVILGHSHQRELVQWPEGTYVNTGSWHHEGTFLMLEAQPPTALGALAGAGSPQAPELQTGQERPSGCRVRPGSWNGSDFLWYSDVEITLHNTPPKKPVTIRT